ncbi:phage tail tip fiber protein [Brenneria alni]|uniref:phage tail tip fiber protein n=1 Tax=Brenneria alni TaxID=71656 RepID=UPI0030B8261E
MDAVADNIETLTGQRGDGSSRAVTYADLASLGLANLRTLGGKLKLTPSTGGSGESSNGKVQTPTKPTNFKATGGFAHVLLEWDMPQYSGRSLTEIYRSPEDNLANAVLIASTAAGVYGDPVDPEWKGYYWIRHVNSLGKPGPYNDSSGTYAETHADPTSIIDVINEQLNNSPLIEEMSGKIEENASAVQTNTQAIADLDGVKAMWSTRAQAGDITAGIGIVASTDSNGNTISQVAIAAGQVFIFDPNNPNDDGTYAIPFAVVDGKVVLDELVAKEAVIKILAAQTIMADSVKVGIEIVSPYIKTAKIESGGFTVDELGNATFGQLVSISAAGQISIKSNTDNVGLNITNNEIILRDENNINRIEIGL